MSTDYSLTSGEVVSAAYQLPGVLPLGAVATADQAAQGLQVLNLMLKTLGTQQHLWLTTYGTVALVAGQIEYSLPLVRRMNSVRRKTGTGVNAQEVPLQALGRTDYDLTPNKASTGTPVSYYFNPQVSTRTLYVWPTAQAQVALTTTLAYTYQRVIDDCAALNGAVDIPQEWFDCIVYNLAVRLARASGQATNEPLAFQDLQKEAARLLAVLMQDDQESTSVFLSPSQY